MMVNLLGRADNMRKQIFKQKINRVTYIIDLIDKKCRVGMQLGKRSFVYSNLYDKEVLAIALKRLICKDIEEPGLEFYPEDRVGLKSIENPLTQETAESLYLKIASQSNADFGH